MPDTLAPDTATPAAPLPAAEVEERLRVFFEENYEVLRFEGGHRLAPDVLDGAFQQVLAYWRKLRDVAERVTDTEVKLTLPNQTTPEGRRFGIEGVVDIVREEGHTILYDLKTHEADYVRQNLDSYAPQLNVYAHIWQVLRGQDLNETAIISTVLPEPLREALNRGDQARLDALMARWEPLIPIPFDNSHVAETVAKFGAVVDKIESHEFAPPPVEVLGSSLAGQSARFVTNVCRNCDARYSCDSYREYVLQAGLASARTFRAYYTANTTDVERDDWLRAGLLADDDKNLDLFE